MFLAGRVFIWLVQRIHDRYAAGRSFRRLERAGALDEDITRDAEWRTHELFNRTWRSRRLTPDQRRRVRAVKDRMREDYLERNRPGLYQYVVIFLIASVLGLILETA